MQILKVYFARRVTSIFTYVLYDFYEQEYNANIFIESVCCSEMYYIKGWLCILVEESMSEKQKRIKINIEMLLAGYVRF